MRLFFEPSRGEKGYDLEYDRALESLRKYYRFHPSGTTMSYMTPIMQARQS